MTVKLERLIRFVEAHKLHTLAREQEAAAIAGAAEADRRLRAAWDALTPKEQEQLNDTYAGTALGHKDPPGGET